MVATVAKVSPFSVGVILERLSVSFASSVTVLPEYVVYKRGSMIGRK